MMIDKISLALVIIGAINWGSIGLFQFDIVAWIFGGQGAIVSRIIYTLVASPEFGAFQCSSETGMRLNSAWKTAANNIICFKIKSHSV